MTRVACGLVPHARYLRVSSERGGMSSACGPYGDERARCIRSYLNWRALLPSRLVGQAHACTRGLARVVSRRGWSANHLPTFASVGTIVRCEWARAVSDARVLSPWLPAPLCPLADVGGQAHVSRYINDESIGPHH